MKHRIFISLLLASCCAYSMEGPLKDGKRERDEEQENSNKRVRISKDEPNHILKKILTNGLCDAAQSGLYDLAQTLIRNGADVNGVDEHGHTPLIWAILADDLKMITLLIANNALLDHQPKGCSYIPLHLSAYYNRAELAQLLINSGASVAVKDNCLNTALHWAAEKGALAVVKVLLENNSDVLLEDQVGMNPLHCALLHGNYDIAQYLVEHLEEKGEEIKRILSREILVLDTSSAYHGKRSNLLFLAAETGDIAMMQFLIDKGIPLVYYDKFTLNLLERAYVSERKTMVKFLLDNGVKRLGYQKLMDEAARLGNQELFDICIREIEKGNKEKAKPEVWRVYEVRHRNLQEILDSKLRGDYVPDRTTDYDTECEINHKQEERV